MSETRLLICDLDNTLYDWVAFFVPSFYAMVDEAVKILNCDRDQLLDDLKSVHQKYHDSEHPFALLETDTVNNCLAQESLEQRRSLLDPAFKAFNSVRKKNLALYPGVTETLIALENRGVRLIAHSESRVYSVMFRMKSLGITKHFDKIYCLERPAQTMVDNSKAESFWSDFPTEKIVEIAHHQRKPNPGILREILDDARVEISEAAYIGDSLAKDVFMAKETGCKAIWAKYGTKHNPKEYDALVRVSHWTAAEVAREAQLKKLAKEVKADFVAENSFSETLGFLAAVPHSAVS
jgi:phosphoglycolate phosphatase